MWASPPVLSRHRPHPPAAISRSPCALAALLLFVLAPFSCNSPLRAQAAQPARLAVEVVDSAARPGAGTQVRVSGAPTAALSDSAGIAAVERIPPGSRLVIIRRSGYAPENAIIRFQPGADLRIRVTLTPAPVGLDTIRVVGLRQRVALSRVGFYRRQRQGQGSYLTREDLAKFETMSPDLGIALGRLCGLRVTRPGGRMAVMSRRGAASLSGGCSPAVYVDGMPGDMGLLESLPPGEVEAIEGYAGAAAVPAEYASQSTCGVILVWMRTG